MCSCEGVAFLFCALGSGGSGVCCSIICHWADIIVVSHACDRPNGALGELVSPPSSSLIAVATHPHPRA